MNPYLILGVVLSSITLAFSSFIYGKHIEDAKLAVYKAQQITIQEKAKADSEAKVRSIEQQADSKINDISSNYQSQINALEKSKDSLSASVNAGSKRLYVRAYCPDVSKAPPSESIDHGETYTRLSNDTANRLINLAERADEISIQLAAAQQVIAQDRITCNGDINESAK
jgi:hypothetical protein